MGNMVHKITFSKINCDLPVGRAFFKDPKKTKETKISKMTGCFEVGIFDK